MIIKPPSQEKNTLNLLRAARSKFWVLQWAVIVGFLAAGSFAASMAFHKTEMDVTPTDIDPELQEEGRVRYEYKPSLSRPERIEIAVAESDFKELARQRHEALQAGVLVTTEDSFVPAKIRYKDQTVRAKMRLKGDWVDHLKGPKWSYRISLKQGDVLFGMQEFSIQHPLHRGFLRGWLFQEVLRREGVLSLRVKLIDVTLNGKDLGLYYLEEHFDKVLVENQQYREGPIIKFDEDVLWMERKRAGGAQLESPDAFYASAIDVFQPGHIYGDPVLRQEYINAFNLLERFRRGELPVKQVFEIDKLAKYYAFADLMGASHMAYFHNLRYYYNPVTGHLEPIAFDAEAGNLITTLLGSRRFEKNAYYDFDRLLFSDEEFSNAYLKELERIGQPGFLEDLLAAFDFELQRLVNILHKDFPTYVFYTQYLKYNRQFIMRVLHPVKPFHAYVEKNEGDTLKLRLGNIQYLPVRLLGAAHNNMIIYRPPGLVVLPGKDPSVPVDYQQITLTAVGGYKLNDDQLSELKMVYQMTPTGAQQTVDIFPFSAYQEDFLRDDFVHQPGNIEEFPFFVRSPEQPVLFIKPGIWVLEKSLVIPPGLVIIAKEKTTLDLTKGAKILSYSPIYLTGSPDNPVIVKSSDAQGQGLAVINTKAIGRSRLENVVFENLSAPSQNGWSLTGAVTFYEAPVDIAHATFSLNRSSDDSLNLIRSDFTISDSVFSQTYADAVDLDFSNGTVSNTRIFRAGNDAIDFSGCTVKVKGLTIEYANDKGLSVGERSHVEAADVTIRDASNCVAAKDDSTLILENVDLQNCKIGLSAYQKKPEFEKPGKIQIYGLKHQNVEKLAVSSDPSSINLFEE